MNRFLLLLICQASLLQADFFSDQSKKKGPAEAYQPNPTPAPTEKKAVRVSPNVALPQAPAGAWQGDTYLFPGVIVSRGGAYTGGDHLYNISKNIGVKILVLKPEGFDVPLDETAMRKIILDDFVKKGIVEGALSEQGRPPLPIFNILILVYPVGDNFAAVVSGRLLEAVDLKRVILDQSMTFQAITWEKMNLVVGSKDQISKSINETIQEISTAFVERYAYFELLKARTSSN